MPDIFTVPQLQELLSPVFDRYGIRRAVLFGSYGKGTATEKSDVDLLVDSGLRGLRFVGLLDDVKRAVGKDVDLFDVTHIESGSRIDREIRDTGVTVYEK
ncbi:MAG: nucleotidyltransferase domain-containing protein [Firmicutes bacterium]|nr:nucleotidyltransferase domain-containing protein [Bacillota bacterium]